MQAHRRGRVDDAPTSFELAAITSHGVGGSSVIRLVDGELEVGPESVGAAPGPACFGLGGTDATITDVYLLMGILDPSTYLGGTLKLDPARSAKPSSDNIAQPLGVELVEALARMEEAYLERVAEALAAEPTLGSETVIAAFGGAGPMTICGAARRAGRTAGAGAADGCRLQRVRDRLLGRLSALRAAAAERPTPKRSPTRSRASRAGASATCSPRASSSRAASSPSRRRPTRRRGRRAAGRRRPRCRAARPDGRARVARTVADRPASACQRGGRGRRSARPRQWPPVRERSEPATAAALSCPCTRCSISRGAPRPRVRR